MRARHPEPMLVIDDHLPAPTLPRLEPKPPRPKPKPTVKAVSKPKALVAFVALRKRHQATTPSPPATPHEEAPSPATTASKRPGAASGGVYLNRGCGGLHGESARLLRPVLLHGESLQFARGRSAMQAQHCCAQSRTAPIHCDHCGTPNAKKHARQQS